MLVIGLCQVWTKRLDPLYLNLKLNTMNFVFDKLGLLDSRVLLSGLERIVTSTLVAETSSDTHSDRKGQGPQLATREHLAMGLASL